MGGRMSLVLRQLLGTAETPLSVCRFKSGLRSRIKYVNIDLMHPSQHTAPTTISTREPVGLRCYIDEIQEW